MTDHPHKEQHSRKLKQNTIKLTQKQKLYTAWLVLSQFYQLKDLEFLKSSYFLKLCGVNDIQWQFSSPWLKKDFLENTINKNTNISDYKFSCPLNCKTNHYGELRFFSTKKLSTPKKKFLSQLSLFVASTLYFLENKQQMENIKKQWTNTFDSMPQAFCITDKNFKIIRTNQTFQKISQNCKSDLFSKNFFEVFPVPDNIVQSEEQKGSWLVKKTKEGKIKCFAISLKPIFLKKKTSRYCFF